MAEDHSADSTKEMERTRREKKRKDREKSKRRAKVAGKTETVEAEKVSVKVRRRGERETNREKDANKTVVFVCGASGAVCVVEDYTNRRTNTSGNHTEECNQCARTPATRSKHTCTAVHTAPVYIPPPPSSPPPSSLGSTTT